MYKFERIQRLAIASIYMTYIIINLYKTTPQYFLYDYLI